MNTSFYISSHLTLKGGPGHRRPPSVWIAAVSVALAVTVLLLTLSVVSGFRRAITDRVRGFEADIIVEPAYDYATGESDGFVRLTPELADLLRDNLPKTASMSLSMQYPAVLKTSDDFMAIVLNAADAGHNFAFEQSNVVDGELPEFARGEGDNTLCISSDMARRLSLSVGDKIDTYFFVDGGIKARRPVISAIYESNFGESDALVAYTSLPWLQRVAAVDSLTGSRIDLRGCGPLADIPTVAENLQTQLIVACQTGLAEKIYPVDNVTHRASVYFSWLDLLDTNVIVIFILMACVAGFTLVSSLFILILQRISTIGLLRSLGMTVPGVRNIFVYMALRYVAAGMAAGNIIGLGMIFAQQKWHLIGLDPQMYYLDYVPVDFSLTSVIWLNAGVAVAAWLVMILPAGLVATVRPSQTMQFE